MAAMTRISKEERKKLRLQRKGGETPLTGTGVALDDGVDDERFKTIMARNEDELLQFVAKVNRVYQELLGRPAPFMTFVFCGMQSAGKSTIMERFLNSVLNIVQEGTGTRCPLDATCIHDERFDEPSCELRGEELPEGMKGDALHVDEVFKRITEHNVTLAKEDRFSTKPLYLVYRSNNVQNMRFVDTPGIISNKSTGADNREDIKKILRHEMKKPNTKLCVLLEPKEFATNPIVDFCDESFGGRDSWIQYSTFLMTKYDKQLDDSRSPSKANLFFKEFFVNRCFPHLVITPTLAKENLPPEQLFEERLKLIQGADDYETEKFELWREGHEYFQLEHGDAEELSCDVSERIGFPSAKKMMREIMLKDTIARLPEVLVSLREDLDRCNAERKILLDKQEYSDPKTLRLLIHRMVLKIQEKTLQTLDQEIDEEEESDWNTRELNFHSENEDAWRERIARLGELPEEIQPSGKFLGGKHYQRTIEFFRSVLVDALPNPYELRELVPNTTGYLSGGLQQENWERAMVEITKVSLRDVSHPGINYLIKHVGNIFRRLFAVALADIKKGDEFSAKFKLIPNGVEKFLVSEYDDVLWSVLQNTASQVHVSIEPMYSTIDPSLPTFHPRNMKQKEVDGVIQEVNEYEESWTQSLKTRLKALADSCGNMAKDYLKQDSRERATRKMSFLPDSRSAMITKDETDMILQRSFEYIVGLMEFNLYVYKFQMNYHLYQGYKDALRVDYLNRVTEANWEEMIQQDPIIGQKLQKLDDQIKGLTDSLQDVQRMQRSL